MDEPSDLELLRRLHDRDRSVRESAFAEIHRRHAPRSLRLAHRVLGDADLAADVVQEAFLSVVRKGPRFEERARFTSWLFRIVLNRAIDLRRRVRRGPLTGPGAGDAGDDPFAAIRAQGAGPAATARDAERAEIVRAAIARLSPKLMEIVVLRYPEGMSYEEIGELLDLPPGTVRSRLNRAHAALRELLGERLDADPGDDEG